ncbi:MAG TPA: RsmG family class I SAM-dependent methyltransferase [Acidimicrobiales bacterium]|nr:RsmG family class I SAM-dependent methyltransferase [Acidimicrobiales bacterium]
MLVEARDLGFVGPGPVEAHLHHARGFAEVVAAEVAGGGWALGSAVDLGSGAGLPGLPLALRFPDVRWSLIDSSLRRTEFLRRAVLALGLEDRVQVRPERAEESGRAGGLRGGQDLVVARSFGPPAVVAECAAPLLRVGGRAVVSEPPGGRAARWPSAGLAPLGLRPAGGRTTAHGTFQVLVQESPCPARYPRRVGLPAKRPLF